jgi:hypothetical protein
VSDNELRPKAIRWKRNTELDPHLVSRDKDEQDAEDLTVDLVPIYIQETNLARSDHPRFLARIRWRGW